MSRYGKAIVAVAYAVIAAAYIALGGDQRLDSEEWIQIGIAAATAVGVWLVPLAPQHRWGKTAVAAVLAVLQALTTVVSGGVDSSEWLLLLMTAAAVVGVGKADAVSDNGISSRTAPPPPSKHSGTEGTAPGNW